MKRTKAGFILLESMIGLMVAVIGVMTLFWNISESRKVTKAQERKVDYYLAASMMNQTGTTKITLHNHVYTLVKNKISEVEIRDEKNQKTIILPK